MPIRTEAPSVTYYRFVRGRWRGSYEFQAAQSGGHSDGWRARVVGVLSTLLSPLLLETSVDASAAPERGEVIHTTRLSKWGLPLYEATETFSLDENGRDVAVARRERVLRSPFYHHETGRSRAHIEPSAQRAHYRFPLLGVELRQTVSVEQGEVHIVQSAPGLHAQARLTRC